MHRTGREQDPSFFFLTRVTYKLYIFPHFSTFLVKFSRMPPMLTRKESCVLGNTYSTVQILDADVHVVRTKIPPQALLETRLRKKEQPRSGQAWFALRKKDDLLRFTDHAHQANPYVEAWTDLGTFSLSIVGNLPLFSLLLSFTFSSDFVTVSWTRIHRSTAQPEYEYFPFANAILITCIFHETVKHLLIFRCSARVDTSK